MAFLKQNLKQILVQQQQNKYNKELSEKKMSYDFWIRKQEEQITVDNIIVSEVGKCQKNDKEKSENEGNKNKNEGFLSTNNEDCHYYEVCVENGRRNASKTFLLVGPATGCAKKPVQILQNIEKNHHNNTDVILFQVSEGRIAEFTLQLMYRELCSNHQIVLIYGDEDVQNGQERCCPWLKPDWSPDTFLSSFYFGSLIGIPKVAISKLLEEQGQKAQQWNLYELCLQLLRENGGFAMKNQEEKICHIPEILFHADRQGYEKVCNWKLPESLREATISPKDKVSVIIPSKDNPKVLFHCIQSLLTKTRVACDYEIIIIDNGSNSENKAVITEKIESIKNIRYYYEPMTFNFSRMCNRGASYGTGNYLLFLNDDMEIIQEDWLSLLLEKARLPYAGAVGAKLLYPDSPVIQHAGITNLRVGPAHKLQFLSDEENHYYGRNRGVHDMMAVTGACLLVKREVFNSVGGFATELAVAFNDVDLCYKIWEQGYYNIVRNDVVLYHHESLSRGKDGESEEKQKRLLREKDVLYERHQKLYGKDPFYHKYLTGDMLESAYSPAYHYQVTLDMPWAKVTKQKALSTNVRKDNCVVIGMEGAMDIYKWKYGVAPGKGEKEPVEEELGYYFQGYTFVIGANNACYKNALLLENKETGQVLKVEIQRRYRPDIRKNLNDQINVELTGFTAKVRWRDIPKGEYRFAMLAEDTCSRQKLVSYSSWVLQVDGMTQQVSDTLPGNK